MEQALADALENGQIAAAGLDVLAAEPWREDNPLRLIKDSEKLLITPHIGLGKRGGAHEADAYDRGTDPGVF